MRIAHLALSLGLILGYLCSGTARGQDLPKPTARIDFGNLSQLIVSGSKPQVVEAAPFGKVLKTDQIASVIGWDMSKAKMSWDDVTISFWIQPVDWSGEPRFRQWLFTKSPPHGRAFNLAIGQFGDGGKEIEQAQLMDIPGTRVHLWNNLSKWENGRWYSITLTWSKEKLSLYVNGETDPIGHGVYGETSNFKYGSEVFKDSILYLGSSAGWRDYPTPENTLLSAVEIRNVCLSPEDVRRLYYAQKPADSGEPATEEAPQIEQAKPAAPRMVVPANATAPTIDGNVEDAEWADAAVFYGMNDGDKGVFTDKPYVAYLKSDGKTLYFAIKSKVPSTEFMLHEYTKRDSNTPLDDSWEFFLYPDLKATEFYQIVVNSEGAIFDWFGKNVAWNGDWNIKQRIVAPDVWDTEMSIPLEEIGITGDLDGHQSKIALYFNQRSGDSRSFTWAPLLGLFDNPTQMGTITFKKDANVARLNTLGTPLAGIIAPSITWTKPGAAASATLTDRAGKKTRKIIDAANPQAVFDPLIGTGKAELTIVSPPDATPQEADFHYTTIVGYDSIPVTVKLTNYPSREEATLELNFASMPHAADVAAYRIDFGNGPQVIQRESKIPWERVKVSSKGVQPGPHTCKVELLDSASSVRLTKELAYTKEGAEPWLHNTIGIEKGLVPPPYTPIKITDNVVEIIGRKIELDPTGLPHQITSAGGPILAAPIKISGTFDEKSADLQASSAFAFTDVAADDSVGSAEVKIGPLSGKLTQTISFDGLCWYDIQLTGKSKAKDVSIEIPLTAEAVRYYQLTDTDMETLGIREWEVGDVLVKDMNLPFTPQVYLGNDKAGLSWMAETEKGWQVSNDRKAIEIRKRGDVTLLRINLVDAPIDLDGLTVSFGLQPTPVKPVTRDQQLLACAPGRWPGWSPDIQVHGVYIGQDATDKAKVVSYAGLPEPANPDLSRKLAAEYKQQGYRMVPYSEITWLSMGLPEMQIYGGDWYLNQPWAGTAGSAANPEPFGLVDIENRDYQDFIVWRFINCWDGYGGGSVYFDLFSPHQDKLPEHHRGYTTRTGKTAYPWPIRGTRAIARRLYIGYKQKNPDFRIFTHASNMYTALISMGDAWPIGEQYSLTPTRYPEVLTYDRFRAFLYGYPIGLKTMFLPALKTPSLVEQTELTNYLVGIVFNHNCNFWVCFINQPILLPHLRVYLSQPWAIKEFLPYWEHPDLTNLDPAKFKVSGWYDAEAKKGLLMIASLSPTEVTADIALGKGWTSSKATTLTNPIPASEFGDWKPPATFDGSKAVFAPYGVLMLEVK